MKSLFLFCRPGFEDACAAEVSGHAGRLQLPGWCRARPGDGFVLFTSHAEDGGARLYNRLALDELVFARQWFVVLAELTALPPADRIGPLLASLDPLPEPVRGLWMETPDSNEGKSLSTLARKLERPLQRALADAGRLADGSPLWLHCCLLGGDHLVAGYACRHNSAPWPGGIPRLKMPRSAPSRSTLKLEEALLRLFGDAVERYLPPGGRAVDLGAAPGGWTWQLVRHHQFVTAVDNGPMDAALMDSGQVEHRREDGFRFRPQRPVGWMVCDMVERPVRVAALAADWLVAGWCRHALFNLKLPMKKRLAEVERCLGLVEARLAEANIKHRLFAKQLYHDREEVTVAVVRINGVRLTAVPLSQ